mmetsp:Transcript_25086/g.39419  ORF Transcript_25086/g.39419 Transcript_25086/m.39419 type:complete len:92 (-) Transcript_25086:30-305(-)
MVVPTSTPNRNGIFSVLKCCFKSNNTNSEHFHAHEDSVQVMIKHDKKVAMKKGSKDAGVYEPRAPLPDRLAAGRRSSNPSPNVIQATDSTD